MSGGWGGEPRLYAQAYAQMVGPIANPGPISVQWIQNEDPHGIVAGGQFTLPVAGLWFISVIVEVRLVVRLTAVAYRQWTLAVSDWDVSPQAQRGLQRVDTDPALTPHAETLTVAYTAWQDAGTNVLVYVTQTQYPGGDQWRLAYGTCSVAYLGNARYPF